MQLPIPWPTFFKGFLNARPFKQSEARCLNSFTVTKVKLLGYFVSARKYLGYSRSVEE